MAYASPPWERSLVGRNHPDGRNNGHVKQKEHSSLNELYSFKILAFNAIHFLISGKGYNPPFPPYFLRIISNLTAASLCTNDRRTRFSSFRGSYGNAHARPSSARTSVLHSAIGSHF